MTLIVPSQAALAELGRRRETARRRLAGGGATREAAERHLRHWCAIAAWFGAVLSDDLRPVEGRQLFTDWSDAGQSVEAWRREIAAELRRAALAEWSAAGETPRLAALLTLDRHLGLAAGLPPIILASAERNAA